MRNGELGFWWRSLGGVPDPRPPLEGPCEADVAVVGAGYTGLWSAYYLKRARPSLRVVVLEREFAGYGASARNGGWVAGSLEGPARVYERRGGPAGLLALRRAMFDTVDEVGRVLAAEGIEADQLKSGHLDVALNDAQVARLRARLATARESGIGERDLRAVEAEELRVRLRVAGARLATFTPHVVRVHPARLLVGLRGAVERLGVSVYERTCVRELRPREALTPAGAVRARWVIRATEGYTPGLAGLKRALVPVNSSIVITEPLTPAVWEEIGWTASELLGDAAHVFVYLQRTADGRIAIGGRGVPYRFASRTDRSGETAPATVATLAHKLAEMFPAAATAPLDHAWSGVLGVPRDWCPSVGADANTGLAWAGGYTGLGVAAANLAARTLRDLVLGEPSELTRLPWVGRHSRRWEPEPVRWLAIRGIYSLYRQADRAELRSGRPSRLGALLDTLSGRR
ncbi:MAG: FAD-dependent oxidoreductase [Actinobacteria bacterium]|nr:MAG: FAD-dependent oxidoreductase [Actinomycetota bacterium]